MFIGVTGTNASGKSEVVRYIKEIKKCHSISLSDMIREEADKRGLPKTVDNLVALGNELREKYGADVFASRVADKFLKAKDITRIKKLKFEQANEYTKQRAKLNNNAVIDSIRNPAEVYTLRKRLQRSYYDIEITSAFYIIAVDADKHVRFERFNERKRADEQLTPSQFQAIDARSLGEGQLATGQRLKDAIEMADYLVTNEGNKEELHEKVEGALRAAKQYQKDLYYMGLAFQSSSRSDCTRRMLGAVRVYNDTVLKSGYNGAPPGFTNCNEDGCPRCNNPDVASGKNLDLDCICNHAEYNACKGTLVEGSTLYTVLFPCIQCTKDIANSQISRIVYCDGYANDSGKYFKALKGKNKIEIVKLRM